MNILLLQLFQLAELNGCEGSPAPSPTFFFFIFYCYKFFLLDYNNFYFLDHCNFGAFLFDLWLG